LVRLLPRQRPLAAHPAVKHLINVEDGPDRAFRVKRWLTLSFLSDGQEIKRLVRPTDGVVVVQALAAIDPVGSDASGAAQAQSRGLVHSGAVLKRTAAAKAW
jgi:hypothetical protein